MQSILTRKSYFNTRRPIKLPDPTIFTVTRSSKSKTQIKKAIIWIILVGYKVHKSNWKFLIFPSPAQAPGKETSWKMTTPSTKFQTSHHLPRLKLNLNIVQAKNGLREEYQLWGDFAFVIFSKLTKNCLVHHSWDCPCNLTMLHCLLQGFPRSWPFLSNINVHNPTILLECNWKDSDIPHIWNITWLSTSKSSIYSHQSFFWTQDLAASGTSFLMCRQSLIRFFNLLTPLWRFGWYRW